MLIKKLCLTALVSFASVSQAFALSCVQSAFELKPTYNKLADSSDRYAFVVGSFSNIPKKPRTGSGVVSQVGKPFKTKANFKGSIIGKSTQKPVNGSISVHATCIASVSYTHLTLPTTPYV